MTIDEFVELFGRSAFGRTIEWRVTDDGRMRNGNQCPLSFVANVMRGAKSQLDAPEFFAGLAGEAGRYLGVDGLTILDVMDAADIAESSVLRVRQLRARLLACIGIEEKAVQS